MLAFTSARYTVPLGHHSYPIDKYHLVPTQLLAEGTLHPDEIVEPEAATLDDVLRVHTLEYAHAFINGTLEHKAMLRLGLPWSPELVRRAFAVIGGGLRGTATAAEIRELLNSAMVSYPALTAKKPRVLLIEQADEILPLFDSAVGTNVRHKLTQLGVEVITGTRISGITPNS